MVNVSVAIPTKRVTSQQLPIVTQWMMRSREPFCRVWGSGDRSNIVQVTQLLWVCDCSGHVTSRWQHFASLLSILWLSYSFQSLFLQCPLSLGRVDTDACLGTTVRASLIRCTLTSCEFLQYPLQSERLWRRLTTAQIYGDKDKYLEGLSWCPYNKIQ